MLSQHRYVNTYLDPHVINYVQGNPCVIIYVRVINYVQGNPCVINYVQGESTCNELGSGGSTIGVNNKFEDYNYDFDNYFYNHDFDFDNYFSCS
jgi:hypothetical protein